VYQAILIPVRTVRKEISINYNVLAQ